MSTIIKHSWSPNQCTLVTIVMELSGESNSTVPAGKLHALRISQSMVALRTLAYNQPDIGEVHVGIQASAKGIYKCVATNFNKTNNISVTINPTGNLKFECVNE